MIHRILTILSALLLLSALSLWIASYLQPYKVNYHRLNTVFLGCVYQEGRFRFLIMDPTYLGYGGERKPITEAFGFEAKPQASRGNNPKRWSFICHLGDKGGIRWRFDMTVPFWFLSMLLAVYPFFALIRSPYRRRNLRRKMGLCLKCGYNLKGNVSGVCPECGEKI